MSGVVSFMNCLIFGVCILSPLYPDESGGQIANRHYEHYKKQDVIKLYSDLHRWNKVKDTIRTDSLYQQSLSADDVTRDMMREPLHVLLDFIDTRVIPTIPRATLENSNEAAIGNLAYMLIHLPPMTTQWKELAKFYTS